ncbi:helix-turn-helix domain-containing protein [Dysgonomonas termitidis]|uniref:Helix-turn-helix domain-containing protein n=1 Tax=Dysgonomonas termitidis TaxID=1516126 RepID=A0ABV9L3F8_9BACT
MESLHFNGHIACQTCLNYAKGARPAIETKEISIGSHNEQQALQSKIIFLLRGEITYSFGMYNNRRMRCGQMLYLPVGYNFSYRAESGALLLFIRPYCKLQFCDSYRLENLVHRSPAAQVPLNTRKESPYLLEMKETLRGYTDMLVYCIRKGLCCGYYNELKIKELLYLLGESYTKEELGLFFYEALSSDSDFSQYIMDNYHNYHSLTELAAAMNMSLSGIEKRFRKVFNISGYKWMNEHRAKKIYHALCSGDHNLKELSSEFGFASESTFNRFCKQRLGRTPGEIRQHNRQGYETGKESVKMDNRI